VVDRDRHGEASPGTWSRNSRASWDDGKVRTERLLAEVTSSWDCYARITAGGISCHASDGAHGQGESRGTEIGRRGPLDSPKSTIHGGRCRCTDAW
jgi:hypothetical protein